MKDPRIIRRQLFTPYAPGQGPSFLLTVVDVDQSQDIPYRQRGKYMLGYRLEQIAGMSEKWEASEIIEPKVEIKLFAGMDFGVPPIHSIDGPEPVQALMNFLCLRPGDTDDNYFDDYTEAQLDFARSHAEALAAEVDVWFQCEMQQQKAPLLDATGTPIPREPGRITITSDTGSVHTVDLSKMGESNEREDEAGEGVEGQAEAEGDCPQAQRDEQLEEGEE
jgi:hypothetical protein